MKIPWVPEKYDKQKSPRGNVPMHFLGFPLAYPLLCFSDCPCPGRLESVFSSWVSFVQAGQFTMFPFHYEHNLQIGGNGINKSLCGLPVLIKTLFSFAARK